MSRLYFVRYLFICVLFVWLLASCAHPFERETYSYRVVEAPDSVRIRFEGKGAEAGVMLSSSMGPMGIAIGVAIDEGIAKDIDDALNIAGCKLHDVVSGSFQAASRVHATTVTPITRTSERRADILIRLDQVKFKTLPSEQDLTSVLVALAIDKASVIRELVSDSVEADSGIPLAELRSSGGKACELMRAEATQLFDEWYRRQ